MAKLRQRGYCGVTEYQQKNIQATDSKHALRVPENIEIAYIPPYSPELNPQEQIWDELREKFFGNKFFTSLQAVIDTAVQGLQHLEASPLAVASLTQRAWQ